jgi:small subunit ribosomal protein S21
MLDVDARFPWRPASAFCASRASPQLRKREIRAQVQYKVPPALRRRELERADTSWPGSRSDLQIGAVLLVFVKDNNIDQALKVLKKRMQREGVFREMKRRRAYEKPSERRIREQAEAVRRSHKAARKNAQREGLIPTPKRVEKKPPVSSPR